MPIDNVISTHWGYCEKLTVSTIAVQNTSASIHILSDLQCDHVRNWQRAGWEISESKKAEPRIIRAVKCHSSFSNALLQRVTDIKPPSMYRYILAKRPRSSIFRHVGKCHILRVLTEKVCESNEEVRLFYDSSYSGTRTEIR